MEYCLSFKERLKRMLEENKKIKRRSEKRVEILVFFLLKVLEGVLFSM